MIRRLGGVWGAAAVPLAVLGVGAFAARPIADDYTVEAKLATLGPLGAVGWYLNHWTAYYSTYSILTTGAAVAHAARLDSYFECGMTIVMAVGLLVAASSSLRWMPGQRGAPALLAVALLGSFVTLASPGAGALYAATLFAPAWVSHFLPVLLAPMVLRMGLRTGARRGADLALLGVLGIFVGGFGLAETGALIAAVVGAGWAAHRIRGSVDLGRVASLIAGLLLAAVLIQMLPGTAIRQAYFQREHLGLSGVHTPAELLRRLWHFSLLDLRTVVLSPAPILGFLLGWRLRSPIGDGWRTEGQAISVVTRATLAVIVVTCIMSGAGDMGSYYAPWHLFTLWTLVFLLFGTAGWAAARRHPKTYSIAATGLTIACVTWCTMLLAAVSSVAWDRRPIFDQNVRSVAADRASERTLGWRSVSVGLLNDGPPDVIARWIDVPSSRLNVTVEQPPSATGPTLRLLWCR